MAIAKENKVVHGNDLTMVGQQVKTFVSNAVKNKVDKEANKGLSTNDYTDEDKTKLSGIEAGATANAPGTTSPKMNGTAAVGTESGYSRADHVHPTDTTRAPLASPSFTGTPTAPTAAKGTKTIQIATTAFVDTAVSDKVDKDGDKVLSTNDYSDEDKTKLSGIEAGATANAPGTTSPKMNGTAAVGTESGYSRADHVHPTDTTRAPLASPTFTGTPKAPTAAEGTNTTQIATTAFVKTATKDFINKAVNDLTNYYNKDNTYSKSEVDAAIAAAATGSFVSVATLPAASADTVGKIYLVPKTGGSAPNVKDEYVTVRSGNEGDYSYAWELIGATEIDLSGYVTEDELEALTQAEVLALLDLE